MSRYAVAPETREGETLMVLRDSAGPASARVWPAGGNNCLAARLAAPDGRGVEVILAPEALEQVRQQPSWWGVPLLFPWPGRIPAGEYIFAGRRYRLPVQDMNGNAGHGFVKTRPFHVAASEATDAHALLQCTISSDDHPETLEGYPFPYRLTATYRLDARGLTLDVAVQNTGEGPLPFGFGAHPYFRIPIAPGGRREDCRVTVPAARRWNLGRIGALTLDAPLTRDDVTEPVGDAEDLRRPRPLERRRYDGGFTDLVASGGWVECAVLDPAAGLALVMECSDSFGTVVVYTPAGRPGVCFEPWTCPPNAFNLLAAGVEDSGVVVLPPGESWRGTMRLSVRAMGQESPAPE